MKKMLTLCLALVLTVCLSACGSAKIEDTNGADNFSLNTITDQNILKCDLPSTGYTVTTSGLLSKKVEISAKSFSGVKEVLWTNMIAGDFVLDLLEFNLTGGNFRMVLVNEGKIVAEIAPGTTHIELKNAKGTVALCIAGESAAFSFSMFESEYNRYAHT